MYDVVALRRAAFVVDSWFCAAAGGAGGPAPSHAKRDGMTDKKPEITCSACSRPRWACARVADSPVLKPCTLACPHAGGPGLGTDKEFVSNLTLLMKKCVEQHERG